MSWRIDLHLCKAVEIKYLRPDDKDLGTAYIRALEDATRDVKLTAKDYQEIAEEIRRNELKRRDRK